MKIKKLGAIAVSEIGLGCMGMSEFYGQSDDAENLRTLDRALELGCTFWDTADVYGPFKNEILIAEALKGRRQSITLATKFGIVRDPNDPSYRSLSAKPDYVKAACEASLKRLNIDTIDLYYLHRMDPNTPIEDTVGAMADLVKEGKVRALGLSEVSAATLKRAHAVHPISALQTEYSLWSRDPENEVLDACKELGVGFVAYSPLGRGFLSGQIQRFEDFEENDFRRNSPRFMGDNFEKNIAIVHKLKEFAKTKGCTVSQLALAWVMAQADHIVPIPGTRKIRYLEENIQAKDIVFSPEELKSIELLSPKNEVAGDRYNEAMMKILNS